MNFGHVWRGVFINGKPTQPGMPQMLWVLPELAPIKASSIPKAVNTGRKRASLDSILYNMLGLACCSQGSVTPVEATVVVILGETVT